MFVLSVKHSRKRTIVILAVLLVAVTAAIFISGMRGRVPQAECAGKKYSLSAGTNDERVAFFKQFGWKVDAEPVSEGDVTIPAKFDDVYVVYNNIQKEQGLDLEPYAGKTCRQWVYTVTNYHQQKAMRGTLLVYSGRVIGGDLSTPELNGFMTGFDGTKEEQNFSVNQPALARTNVGGLTNASSAPQASSAVEVKKPASSAVPANAWPTD